MSRSRMRFLAGTTPKKRVRCASSIKIVGKFSISNVSIRSACVSISIHTKHIPGYKPASASKVVRRRGRYRTTQRIDTRPEAYPAQPDGPQLYAHRYQDHKRACQINLSL